MKRKENLIIIRNRLITLKMNLKNLKENNYGNN